MLKISEIDKPFRELFNGLLVGEVNLLRMSINRPFVIFNDKAKLWASILSREMPLLVKTEKTLQNFKMRMDKIEETKDLYINIREAYGRTPTGYIVDVCVLIPDSNRKIEYQIYDAFGELLKTSSPLLFDLHIIKLRGRKPEEVVPEGFWRYGWKSDYIC